jgi:branched-chain amino acid transport system ATP-binding protein
VTAPAAVPARAAGAETILRVDSIDTFYGDSHILKGLSLEIRRGETVALLGRNGVGKTTTLKSIVGWVPARRGTIEFEGRNITANGMMANARLGISLVPEERRIFTNLTVFENIKLAQVTARGSGGWSLQDVYDHFPRLKERAKNKGDEISGGEKQMLAIARALVQNTRLLLLDEPTEGLAPLIVREVEAIVREIKAKGITILLVEQNFYSALAVADRCYVIDQGTIKFAGTPAELRGNTAVLANYLHV